MPFIYLHRVSQSRLDQGTWYNPEYIVTMDVQSDGTTCIRLGTNTLSTDTFHFVRETPDEIRRLESECYSLPGVSLPPVEETNSKPARPHMVAKTVKPVHIGNTVFQMGMTYDFSEFQQLIDLDLYQKLVEDGTLEPVI